MEMFETLMAFTDLSWFPCFWPRVAPIPARLMCVAGTPWPETRRWRNVADSIHFCFVVFVPAFCVFPGIRDLDLELGDVGPTPGMQEYSDRVLGGESPQFQAEGLGGQHLGPGLWGREPL